MPIIQTRVQACAGGEGGGQGVDPALYPGQVFGPSRLPSVYVAETFDAVYTFAKAINALTSRPRIQAQRTSSFCLRINPSDLPQ